MRPSIIRRFSQRVRHVRRQLPRPLERRVEVLGRLEDAVVGHEVGGAHVGPVGGVPHHAHGVSVGGVASLGTRVARVVSQEEGQVLAERGERRPHVVGVEGHVTVGAVWQEL